MGTRSLTYVYDDKSFEATLPVICMYRQYDGYVAAHGAELSAFLSSRTLVNGLGAKTEGLANGMTCLAALLVCNFKKDTAGNFYLYTPVVGQDAFQDYEYHVFADSIAVYEGNIREGNKIFEGTWESFADFCKEEK